MTNAPAHIRFAKTTELSTWIRADLKAAFPRSGGGEVKPDTTQLMAIALCHEAVDRGISQGARVIVLDALMPIFYQVMQTPADVVIEVGIMAQAHMEVADYCSIDSWAMGRVLSRGFHLRPAWTQDECEFFAAHGRYAPSLLDNHGIPKESR